MSAAVPAPSMYRVGDFRFRGRSYLPLRVPLIVFAITRARYLFRWKVALAPAPNA